MVRGEGREASRSFDIRAGVRQGYVLSPRLFCVALQLAMVVWRGDVGLYVWIFVTAPPISWIFDLLATFYCFAALNTKPVGCLTILVRRCSHVGLLLNMDKTKILTSEAQPPSQLSTRNGLVVDILSGLTSHNWLGCQVSSMGSANTQNDVEFHLNAASHAFHANRPALCDRRVSILERLNIF